MHVTIVDDYLSITCLSIYIQGVKTPYKIHIRGSISDEMIREMEIYIEDRLKYTGVFEAAREFIQENNLQKCQVCI